ncbi:unnamed protein product [Natator depressus]
MALVLVPAFCLLTDDLCQPSLGRRKQPGPSLTCSVRAKCPHHPSWYDRDGMWRSPGQTPGGAGTTELRISPSQLHPGAALRCQVDGYRDECDSDQSQPLGTVAPNVPRVEVLWPAGKAALRGGDSFTLRCQAAALRPIAGYVWCHGDVWLPEAGQDLRVDKAAVSDGGSYAYGVWVSGPGWGYLSLSARESVEVQHAPTGVRVTAVPGTSPHEGESVTLTCNYTSSVPAPNSYTWYRGDPAGNGVEEHHGGPGWGVSLPDQQWDRPVPVPHHQHHRPVHPPCLGSRVHPGTCSFASPAAAGGAGRRHSLEEEAEQTPGTEQRSARAPRCSRALRMAPGNPTSTASP